MEVTIRLIGESPWVQFASPAIGIVGVLVGALMSFVGNALFARQQRLRQARYLAIRVVCALDPFVDTCCDIALDDGEAGENGETFPSVGSPSLALPTDVDWKSIEPDLAYRILRLGNQIDEAKQEIRWVADGFSIPPEHSEYFEERWLQYGKLGLTALYLANELREMLKLPQLATRGHDPEQLLKDAVLKAQQAGKARAKDLVLP